jgi:hypothetical protein
MLGILALGSLTEPLVGLATQLIASLGLGGVALLTLSAGVVGLPATGVRSRGCSEE